MKNIDETVEKYGYVVEDTSKFKVGDMVNFHNDLKKLQHGKHKIQ
jgi:hypothetical protein